MTDLDVAFQKHELKLLFNPATIPNQQLRRVKNLHRQLHKYASPLSSISSPWSFELRNPSSSPVFLFICPSDGVPTSSAKQGGSGLNVSPTYPNNVGHEGELNIRNHIDGTI